MGLLWALLWYAWKNSNIVATEANISPNVTPHLLSSGPSWIGDNFIRVLQFWLWLWWVHNIGYAFTQVSTKALFLINVHLNKLCSPELKLSYKCPYLIVETTCGSFHCSIDVRIEEPPQPRSCSVLATMFILSLFAQMFSRLAREYGGSGAQLMCDGWSGVIMWR